MEKIKYAILNHLEVNTDDPKNGISMVLCDTAEEALDARICRFIDSKEYDINRDIYFSDEQEMRISDGMILYKKHAYYYKDKDATEETHDVYSAWPVYVD